MAQLFEFFMWMVNHGGFGGILPPDGGLGAEPPMGVQGAKPPAPYRSN